MEEIPSGDNRHQKIIIVSESSGMIAKALIRLERHLRLQVIMRNALAQAAEDESPVAGRGLRVLTVDDIHSTRAKAWAELDDVHLSAGYGCYERKNLPLIQARRECAHGHTCRERLRRLSRACMGWRRYRARTRVRHERIRQIWGGAVV